ncbi:MAG: hypothetical protein Q7S32_03470 [bacterium]|nr:hypothetical protein [bacterium]
MKRKLVILILIFALGFSAPFYASDGAGAIVYLNKEFALDTIARAISSRLMKKLGDGVVNSINNLGLEDGKQKPSFVQNWKEFLADAQTVGENQFRSQLKYAADKSILCGDLKSPLALAFQSTNVPFIDIGAKGKYDELKQGTLLPYQTKIKCTIPDKVREDFKKSFEKGGGWETWSRMVQPQNNIAGALSLSLEELVKQRSSQASARQSEVVAGSGFAGVQGACRDGAKGGGQLSECTFLGQTLTPAEILSKGAAGWLDDNKKWLVSSDELSEVLISIFGAAINKLENFAANKAIDLIGTALDSGDKQNADAEKATYTNDVNQDRADFKEIKSNTEDTSNNTSGLKDAIDGLQVKLDSSSPTP